MHAFGNSQSGVQGNHIVQVGGKVLLQLPHQFKDFLFILEGIGTGQLIDCHYGGRLTVQFSDDVVELRAQLDPGDVLKAHHGTILIFTDDDVAELLGGNQPALGGDRIRELLALGGGGTAELPDRIDGVLRVKGVDDIIDGDIQFRELVGLDPEPHGVLAGAENPNI